MSTGQLLNKYRRIRFMGSIGNGNSSVQDYISEWKSNEIDRVIYGIIDGLIKHNNGLDVLINRNPTISFGGILKVRVVGINDDYTMSISLLVLKLLKADFDGLNKAS